jgi:hypothetical protein
MPETNQSKKAGCLTILGLIFLIGIIVNIFKGDGYDVVKEENGIVTAEADIDFDDYSLTAYKIAEIVWRISREFKDSEKITLNIILNGTDFYGKKKADKLDPYILNSDDIIENNKYELDNYKYLIGDEFAIAYLMRNGYWPK